MSTIGENIKTARIKKGLTQQELASALNTTKAAVSRYELDKREPRYRLLQEIAQILDVSCSDLIGDSSVELEMRRSALRDQIQESLTEMDAFEKKMESELLDLYRQLNFEGKQLAADHLAELVGSRKYVK